MSQWAQKNILALIAMLISVALGTSAVATGNAPAPALGAGAGATSTHNWYPVKKVIDGDTISIRMGSKTVKVRLIGLDTPESVDPRRPVQCFGREASDEAKKILNGQSVRIETDSSQGMYDKYGRLLAYVFVNANSDPSGILFNKYMIAEGFGHEYTYDLPYKYQKEFKAAEYQAQLSHKGLWAPGACTNKAV